MSKEIYIVHCIDTEGPMYEPLEDTFERIESIFQIELEPTAENLKKLQNKEIKLGNGLEERVENLISPNRIFLNKNWSEIEKMLSSIQSNFFRSLLKDVNGYGWIYNWFCLDHVNMKGQNPRLRDLGHHKVFDFYFRKSLAKENNRDFISWHYHPLPYTQNYHNSGVAYLNSGNIWDILARKIIERNYFPSSYRPGFHTIRPDSNWFLEQWIPFDYSNQSTENEGDQPDLTNGRYGDWRRAPQSWEPYHPSIYDYQVKGDCNRWIFRCLNMEARLRELTQKDVDEAFKRANGDKKTVLSFTNHDFRNMKPEIEKVMGYIKRSMEIYPDVKIHHSNPINAARKVLNLNKNLPDLNLEIIKNEENTLQIRVTSNEHIFGVQPFLAIRTIEGNYLWENFDRGINDNEWYFTFNWLHIPKKVVDVIGIAANSNDGSTEVLKLEIKNLEQEKFKYTYD